MVTQNALALQPSTVGMSPFASLFKAPLVTRESPTLLVPLLQTPDVYIAYYGNIQDIGGKLDSHAYVIIISTMDGGATGFIPLRIVRKKHEGILRNPYFSFSWKLVEQRMPRLTKRLRYFGLFSRIDTKSTFTVLLSRFTLAADKVRVDDKSIRGKMPAIDAHHIVGKADGRNFLGFSTLDCRREVLEPMNSFIHKSSHRKDRGHHYGS